MIVEPGGVPQGEMRACGVPSSSPESRSGHLRNTATYSCSRSLTILGRESSIYTAHRAEFLTNWENVDGAADYGVEGGYVKIKRPIHKDTYNGARRNRSVHVRSPQRSRPDSNSRAYVSTTRSKVEREVVFYVTVAPRGRVILNGKELIRIRYPLLFPDAIACKAPLIEGENEVTVVVEFNRGVAEGGFYCRFEDLESEGALRSIQHQGSEGSGE